jgi:FkbM family methyltransferase
MANTPLILAEYVIEIGGHYMMNRSRVAERVKRLLRMADARLAWRVHTVYWRGRALKFRRTIWWDVGSAEDFEAEITPYFDALDLNCNGLIAVDAGAAAGMFAIALAKVDPSARIFAFEPSSRQRCLLRRNLELNECAHQVVVSEFGLWDKATELSFRTHGAMSSIEGLLPELLPFRFDERIRTITLDAWMAAERPTRLDIVKMDIEGAEIEALRGMRETLSTFRPQVLVQAYHQRDGARTFERCARLLDSWGYECREFGQTGLLCARPTRSL